VFVTAGHTGLRKGELRARHRDPKLTTGTYGHLERSHLLEEVDRLHLLLAQVLDAEPEAAN
jgi:hypothetical protein